MANKVDVQHDHPYPWGSVTDFNNLPNGYVRVNEAYGKMEHSPRASFNGEVFTNNDKQGLITQVATTADAHRYYRDNWSGEGNGWSKWIPYATATSAISYDILFMAGYGGAGSFFKTQENIVFTTFTCYRTDSTDIGGNQNVIEFPKGCRPAKRESKSLMGNNALGATMAFGHLYVDPNGIVTVWPNTEVRGITTDFFFIAE